MNPLKRQTYDNVHRLDCDYLRVKKSKILATTADVTLTLPSASGTLATLDDVSGVSGSFVTLSTTQSISGSKTFSNAQTFITGNLFASNVVNCTLKSTELKVGGLYVDNSVANNVCRLLLPNNAASSVYSLPSTSASLTLAGRDNSETLSNKVLNAQAGTAAAPSYSFVGSADTGMFLTSAGVVNISAGGASRIQVSGASIQLQLPTRWSSNGTAAAPALSFVNDAGNDSGIYLKGSNNIGFSAGGALIMDYDTVKITKTIPIRGENGTLSSPTFAFDSEAETGMYRFGAGSVGLASSGTLCARFGGTYCALYGFNSLGIARLDLNPDTTSGDIFRVYQTRGSASNYFYYNSSNAYGTVSDESVKKNIRLIDTSKASEFINKMTPKRYEIIDDEEVTNNGFVAQDLQQIVKDVGEFSQVVTEHEDGLYGIAHNELLTITISSLKDVLSRIERLEQFIQK